MSRKEKSTVLYSRNGIKIERVDFLDMTKWSNQKDVNVFVINTVTQSLKKKEDKTEVIAAQPAWDEVIKRESKLGFYYYETIHHRAEDAKTIINNKYGGATFKKYTFKYDDK